VDPLKYIIFPVSEPAGKSELLSLVENLDVRFNKLVSVSFNFVVIRFESKIVSETLNFVENLVLRFNTPVSVLDAYKA
jgi:hypothetical protein